MKKLLRNLRGLLLQGIIKSRNLRLSARLMFFATGIASTIWFLVRVIPKPGRAAYPCMRAAAPVMSGFILYLLGAGTAGFGLKKARQNLQKRKFIPAFVFIVLALTGLFLVLASDTEQVSASRLTVLEPPDGPNAPMGEAAGVIPGRVVWVWNPRATDENCTNRLYDLVRGEDGYFLPKNNNQQAIDSMMRLSLMMVAGKESVFESWDTIFRYFNVVHGKGNVAYTQGEKIFIKINQGGAGWLTNSSTLERVKTGWQASYYGMAESIPSTILSLLKTLIDDYGVDQQDILIGDPIAHIYQETYTYLHTFYPDILYMDKGNYQALGRTKLNKANHPAIVYSDKGVKMTGAVRDTLYSEFEEADYLIDMACLKAHARAGVTLLAKNHFGSHIRAGADHLHPALLAPDNVNVTNAGYRKYRVLTDIMGSSKLGRKTLLYIVDGLWGGTEAVEKPVKWKMPPFNNDWPSSLFVSLDQVALESVCFDFLRTEAPLNTTAWKGRPLFDGVDDHLHQAASSANWPAGITYDPDNTGTPIPSLGVHEHWNNSADKQYSRNLKTGNGIELVTWPENLVITVGMRDNKATFSQIRIYPNPAHDIAYLQIRSDRNAEIEIQILNLNGQILRKSDGYTVGSGESSIPLTLQHLESGLYLCRVLVKNSAKTDVFTERIQIIK